MNLDPAFLSAGESAAASCPTARVKLAVAKGPLALNIRLIADSPRRSFHTPKLIRNKTGAALNKNIPSSARSVASPTTQEMIHHLNQYRRSAQGIMDYAIAKASILPEDKAQELIGMLIALLDAKKIDKLPENPDKALPELFNLQLQKLIQKSILDETHPQIQRMVLVREITKLLVTTKGLFNFGLIPEIKTKLLNFFQDDSDHYASVSDLLDNFYTSVTLRDKLSSIPHPIDGNNQGAKIIRISLNLPHNYPIHAYHAQRAALTALLSHPRQEHVANCFALSVAISLFSNSISKCLDDFREILEYGYIKRKVKGTSVTFPALLRQPLTTVNQPMVFDKRLLRLLSIINQELPLTLPKGITFDQLFSLYGEEVRDEARFIWESETKNPLLTVWSNILASMAEAREDGIIKTAIVAATCFTLLQNGVSEREAEVFRKNMLSRVYLHYDPSVSPILRSEEGGAFVLYDKENGFKRIDNPEKFQAFLASIAATDDLKNWLLSPDSLSSLLNVYEEEGSHIAKSPLEYRNLRHTPWITRIGNSPKELLKTYSTHSNEDFALLLTPQSTEELFFRLIAFGREQLTKFKGSKEKHRSILVPMRMVGEHAFNMMLMHPSFFKCLMGDEKKVLSDMYEQVKIKPMMPLPKETEEQMRDYIVKKSPALQDFLNSTPDFCTLAEYHAFLTQKLSEDFVNRKLFQFLPDDLKKELNKTAIHFADTNWQLNGNDIHLAFAYNPMTLKFDIFHAESKGGLLYPLGLQSRMKGVSWEVFQTGSG